MALYAIGETAAIAAIKAAVIARTTTQSDGTLFLDVISLNNWLWEQGLLIIEDDVSLLNKEAARGVLATIDPAAQVTRLNNAYKPSAFDGDPKYPSTKEIASSGAFVAAVAGAVNELSALTQAIAYEYAAITAELPDALSIAYNGTGAGGRLPNTEDRIVESRFYVYTHVNDMGEESAPSPVSTLVEVDQRDTANLSILPPPPGRNIDRWRFYRSNTGTVNAAFQFIAEGPISTTSGADGVARSEMGEVIPTTTWAEPPDGLRGICEMHSGIITGFTGNTTAFSEPFVPYAWPVEYQLSCAYPIVAQESFGQTLVRMHLGGVDFIDGADPLSMSIRKEVSPQVCLSMASVCKVEGGVVFVSPDGICLANGNGVQVITSGRILRDDWQALNPSSMRCHYTEGSVYVWGSAMAYTLAIHIPSGRITRVDLAPAFSCVYSDRMTDSLYGASGTGVYKIFGGTAKRAGQWRSKRFVLPKYTGFAWVSVESDFADGPLQVSFYGDGALTYSVSVSGRAPVVLPSGQALEHEVEVLGRSAWNALTMTSTMAEMREV